MEKTNILEGKKVAEIGVAQMHRNMTPMLDSAQTAAMNFEGEARKKDSRKDEYYDDLKYKKTSLYISRNLHKELKTYCAQQDITITEAINKAIVLFLSQ